MLLSQVCDENTACLASCDSDGLVYLWSMGSTRPIGDLPGHGCRVSRLNYHPSGTIMMTVFSFVSLGTLQLKNV